MEQTEKTTKTIDFIPMRIKIGEMLKTQEEVNKVIGEKLPRLPNGGDYILAFNIEFFEFINEVGVWKWWKHSHVPNKEKVLDELADCFAFFLSLINLSALSEEEEKDQELFKYSTSKRLQDIFESLAALEHENEEMSTEMILQNLITYVGTDNETEGVDTMTRMAIAIYIATLIFPEITWEDIVSAYNKKSETNINRQKENY